MDKILLLETGKKKGLSNKEYIEKDYFQDFFLRSIFSKTNKLIFKGGTALYKLYGMQRFSEDLDFNIMNGIDAEKIIRESASSLNADVKVRKTENSLLIKLILDGILTRQNSIRIDISLKNKVLAGFDVKSYVPEYIDINPFSMRVLKPEEMIAEKMHAIFNRKSARDLYDLFFLLRISDFVKDLTKKKFALFRMDLDVNKFKSRVIELEEIWEPELKPFVMSELPKFSTVSDFVLKKVK